MNHLSLGTLERLPADHRGLGPHRVGDMTLRVRFRSGRLKDGMPPRLMLL